MSKKRAGLRQATASNYFEDPEAWAQERAEALFALFEQYGVKEGDWETLAGVLASRHEPTCKPITPRGPKPKYEAIDMFNEVIWNAEDKGISETRAAVEVFGDGTNAHRQFEKFRDEKNPKLWDDMHGSDNSEKRRPHKSK